MEKDLIKELHQMNIYLKSIAESLDNRNVILKAKPETRKKLEEQITNYLLMNMTYNANIEGEER